MGMLKEHIVIIRKASLMLLGDCCTACGETHKEDLHIHHIDQSYLGEGRGQEPRAWEGLRLAVDKEGILLCRYCHGMLHSKDKMIWLQQNKTEAFREAMRRDFCDELNKQGFPKVELFKERGG